MDSSVNFCYCTVLPIIRTVLKKQAITFISTTGLIIGT